MCTPGELPTVSLLSMRLAVSAFSGFYQTGLLPIRVDILMGIPGGDFNQAWNRRNDIDFDGLIVHFISKEDLIITKRANGRPQDVIDAILLAE